MVIYEITASVREQFKDSYEKYMWERHIPDMMATGHFMAAELLRGGEGLYRIRYSLYGRNDLEAYMSRDSERLRADFAGHFPSGVEITRNVWDVLETWTEQAAQAGSY